jgi:hypothetical protein
MSGAWLVVRAVVSDPGDRAAFDAGYHNKLWPDAVTAFSAGAAWRGWSATDPAIHCAYHRFQSMERLDAVMPGPAIEARVAEIGRCSNAPCDPNS